MKAWGIYIIYALAPLGFVLGVMANASQQPDQKPPDAQQLQNTITQLVQMLNESRETQQAQAAALVNKSQQIQALQQGIGPACVASVEKANPGKTLDDKTFAIKDKPVNK